MSGPSETWGARKAVTERLAAWCSRHPWIVLAIALVLGVGGELGRRGLSRDVIPDLSDPQIVLVADWMGHPAPEVAREVTQVLTRALDGIAGATSVRGQTMAGMAYIDVVFAPSTELADARRAIEQRIAGVRLPQTARLTIGPLASSTGWVFEYAIIDPLRKKSRLELRHFQDDVLRPALANLPGIAEIAS
ncbi:MAG: efflux RND transporter permease subunit, partial [Solirubrobacteraceae bacterium]